MRRRRRQALRLGQVAVPAVKVDQAVQGVRRPDVDVVPRHDRLGAGEVADMAAGGQQRRERLLGGRHRHRVERGDRVVQGAVFAVRADHRVDGQHRRRRRRRDRREQGAGGGEVAAMRVRGDERAGDGRVRHEQPLGAGVVVQAVDGGDVRAPGAGADQLPEEGCVDRQAACDHRLERGHRVAQAMALRERHQHRRVRRQGRRQARRPHAPQQGQRVRQRPVARVRAQHRVERDHAGRRRLMEQALGGRQVPAAVVRGDQRADDDVVLQHALRRRVRVQRLDGADDAGAAAARPDDQAEQGAVDVVAGAHHLVQQVDGVGEAVVADERDDQRRVRPAAGRRDAPEDGEGVQQQAVVGVRGQHGVVDGDGLDQGRVPALEDALGGGQVAAPVERGDERRHDDVAGEQAAPGGVRGQRPHRVAVDDPAAGGDDLAEHGHVDVDAPGDHDAEQGEGVARPPALGQRRRHVRVDAVGRRVQHVEDAQGGVQAPPCDQRLDQVAEGGVARRVDRQVEQALGGGGAGRFGGAGGQDGEQPGADGDVVGDGVADQEQGGGGPVRHAAHVRQAEHGVVRPGRRRRVPVEGGADVRRRRAQAGGEERAEQRVVDGEAARGNDGQHVGRFGRRVRLAERHHRREEADVGGQAGLQDGVEDEPGARRVRLPLQGAHRQRDRAPRQEPAVLGRRARRLAVRPGARRQVRVRRRVARPHPELHLAARAHGSSSLARSTTASLPGRLYRQRDAAQG